ncbi:MAG: SagB/ThcOx family dehydrogenase [Haloferacaceae archaeon]
MPDDVPATDYHERTEHSPESVRSGPGLNFANKPTPYKIYEDLPHEGLPDEPSDPGTPALEAVAVDRSAPPARAPFDDSPPTRIDRETLAQLCYYAAGVTKEVQLRNRTVAFRAAACTGALYHVDLYPVVGDLADLDPGVYHYDPRTDSLDVLREGDYRGVLAAAAEHDRVAEAPVTFVLTSTWWRNAWKYGERTFRHAFWDSGTVAANLAAVAHARGLPASVVMGFADGPAVDLLGLDPTDEAPLELVPVGAADPAPAPPTVDPIDPGTEPLSPDPKPYPLIPRAWHAGTLGDGGVADWRRDVSARVPIGCRGPGEGERIPLDPVDRETASSRPLGNTIVRRGSCREYEREPISFRKLSTVLDRAIRGGPLDVRDPDGPPLQYTDCYLIANAVEGIESGVYHLQAAEGELERLRRGEFRQDAGHLALDQPLGADAAVCLHFMADVESVTETAGDRGYRVAQFEAALTAGRLYLATYAHRTLGGTGLTFYDDRVTDFLSPRAAGQTPMFLYTIGRPA